MTRYDAKFVIKNSTSLPRYPRVTEEIKNLRKGDVIEIAFEEENAKGDYEVVDIKETWSLADNGDDTYHYEYTVKLVSGTLKPL